MKFEAAQRLADSLTQEFATVDTILDLRAVTSRVDAFALTWIKVEKQLRRLFAYLIFLHPGVTRENREEYIGAMVENKNLSFESLITCFNELSSVPLATIVGARYGEFMGHMQRIRAYRNKILHGQLTGKNLTAENLEADIKILRAWVKAVADGCQARIGYDGVGRNTFMQAKRRPAIQITYPFKNATEFKSWLPKKR